MSARSTPGTRTAHYGVQCGVGSTSRRRRVGVGVPEVDGDDDLAGRMCAYLDLTWPSPGPLTKVCAVGCTLVFAAGEVVAHGLVFWSALSAVICGLLLRPLPTYLLSVAVVASSAFAFSEGQPVAALAMVPAAAAVSCWLALLREDRRGIAEELVTAIVASVEPPAPREEPAGTGVALAGSLRSLARLQDPRGVGERSPATAWLAASDEEVATTLSFLDSYILWSCSEEEASTSPVPLSRVLDDAFGDLRALMHLRGCRLVPFVADTVSVQGDPVLLRRSLTVLLRSVLEKPVVSITVTCERSAEFVRLLFEGRTGPVADNSLDEVLEVFTGSRHPYGELALPAVHRWLSAMGASLEVPATTSQGASPGGGSTADRFHWSLYLLPAS